MGFLFGGGSASGTGWVLIHDADMTGGAGTTLNAGDTVTLGGVTYEVSRSTTTVSWTHAAGGMQPSRASGNGQMTLSASLSTILGRTWRPSDNILVCAEMPATLPTAGGTNQIHVGLWRKQSTSTVTFEAALGGRLSSAGNIRARSITLTALGAILQDVNVAFTPGTTEILALQAAGIGAVGWLAADGSLPADGATVPRVVGASTVGSAGGIAAAAYDRIGLHGFLDNGVGSWGTVSRLRMYQYRP